VFDAVAKHMAVHGYTVTGHVCSMKMNL